MSREEIIHQNITDLIKGLIGCGSSLLALIASNLETLEAWLRIASLLTGIAVGIATIISIHRRKK